MPPKRSSPRKSAESPKKKSAKTDNEPEDFTISMRIIDTVRVISAEMVEKACSGHPGAPMGCAPIAYLLFCEFMRYSPLDPDWCDRDRFVLSNGHASALLYTMLHLTGYHVSMDDLKRFRQIQSNTPGHPENFMTPGVEVSTGPLGQGISNAVGLAIAEKNLAATFNTEEHKIVNHYTYVLCGDGCLQEGVSSEASSLAGHLGLGKLIVCYDDNHITIDGDTNLAFTEDVNMRYESYGWHVQTVEDVNDIASVRAAIQAAKEEIAKPSLIKIRTTIGFGSRREGTHHVHGAPLGAVDIQQLKEKFQFNPEESFAVPPEVEATCRTRAEVGSQAVAAWKELFEVYAAVNPDNAAEFSRRLAGRLPDGWNIGLPSYPAQEAKALATRNRSEEILNDLASKMPELIGGSADLTGSNLTSLKCSGDFQRDTPIGRYLRFGVREHAMAAICNGLFAHGMFRPFCATFLNFIGYALGSVRLSALSRFGVIYIMTHDSIGQGEDGPTHQPVEMLDCLRATPNLLTIRPADGNETAGAYEVALSRPNTPSVLSFSRQASPTLEGTSAEKVALGAYLLREFGPDLEEGKDSTPALILVATGTEVALAVATAQKLVDGDDGAMRVRVVSMPSQELFEEQSIEYKLSVLPDGVPVMSIEASGQFGWRRYAHANFGMTGFGVSAPAKDVFAAFGFTVPNLVAKALEVIEFYKAAGSVPTLVNFPSFPNAGPHGSH